MNSLTDFWNTLDLTAMWSALLRLCAVLLCLTVHETCHGLAALALGDPTAKRAHRLSLNPLHHIDWFGLAAMLLLGFGWAKPVPVDMRYFKNPKRGMAVTALAGPMSNLLLALLLLFAARGVYAWSPGGAWETVLQFLFSAASLSVGLGVFNLIPLPPLDGSKVLFSLLPDSLYMKLMRYERFGMIALYLLILSGIGSNYLGNAVYAVYLALVRLVF